ncbi:MAG TPA: methyltransferase domain-containing protein [Streptosporangiaceae bacterium]|nr:methyltransferase domain-containing protein [Streptosporangiaceae bacterium]
MGTDWKDSPDVAAGFDAYDDLPERIIGYPTAFSELRLNSAARVLDYGCGPGKVALRVAAEFGAEVTAVDISGAMLGIARQRRPHPRITYHKVASGRLGFLADASFEAAMSCYVFINIGDIAEIQRIASEVFRVLRPGGRYAVLDTNPATTGIQFSTFLSGEPGRSYAAGAQRSVILDRPDGTTMTLLDYHWPRQTYLDVFAEAGFHDVRCTEPLLGDVRLRQGQRAGARPDLTAEAVHPPFLIVSGVK